jgi:hypothetical protein
LRRKNFDGFLLVSLCLDSFNDEFGVIVAEVEPKLLFSDGMIANETKLLLWFDIRILVDLANTKAVLIFVDN